MNRKHERLATRFGPETRFEVRSALPFPPRATQEADLERLKGRLVQDRLARTSALGHDVLLERAANDAAALAWATAFPLLVFPVLFDEKARAALLQAQRQACVRERSRELLAV